MEQVQCPYCHSKDLSVVPATPGSGVSTDSITYRCQMCRRTFSKTASPTPPEETKEKGLV